MHWIYLFLGLGGMLIGANWLVRGCVNIARRFGISEFVVSVIVIGIGTSMPELLVSLICGARDLGTLVVSNNVASSVINIWGVIGLGAVIAPIALDSARRHLADLIFMCVATIAAAIMIWTGSLNFLDGLILFGIFGGYLFYAYYRKMNSAHKVAAVRHAGAGQAAWHSVVLIFAGIFALYAGSEIFMDMLQIVSNANNLNQTIAGILIVAPGTAVPELLVTIIAALRRQPQVAIGNIIGSNFMNMTLVLATGAVLTTLPVSRHIAMFDIFVLLFATGLLCFDLLKRRELTRGRGALYLLLLAVYLISAVMIHL